MRLHTASRAPVLIALMAFGCGVHSKATPPPESLLGQAIVPVATGAPEGALSSVAPGAASTAIIPQRPPGPATAASPQSDQPEFQVADVGNGRGLSKLPKVIRYELPQRPNAYVADVEEVTVNVSALVDAAGYVTYVRTIESHPYRGKAAIKLVKQWRFKPALNQDGSPVAVHILIPIRFWKLALPSNSDE